MTSDITVTVSFTGGLDLLFQRRKSLTHAVPTDTPLSTLIDWLATQCQEDKKSLFIQDGTVRPGILVLVNDADWELEGEGGYVLQDKDEILFVSTLHGG